MSTKSLLDQLRRMGVEVWAEGGKLRYRAAKGVITPALRAQMAADKSTLVALLEPVSAGPGGLPRPADLPLSPAQAGLWLFQQLEPESTLYNGGRAFLMTGALEVEYLVRAFRDVALRHQSLHTRFAVRDGQPCQEIDPKLEPDIEIIDCSDEDAEPVVAVRACYEDEIARPFALATGPLIRVRILRFAAEQWALVIVLHHIVSDALSMAIFIGETAELYRATRAQRAPSLPLLPLQYPDFAIWMQAQSERPERDRNLAWWRRELAGAPQLLELPGDFPRPPRQRYLGRRVSLALSPTDSSAFKALARREGVTPFVAGLAVFYALLFRYTGCGDLVVGTPLTTRSSRSLEGLIGCFVNTLPLRVRLDAALSGRALVARVREVTHGVFAHGEIPLETLVEKLAPERDPAYSPLIQMIFTLVPAAEERLAIGDLQLTSIDVPSGHAPFDLWLEVVDGQNGFTGFIEYNSDLFEEATIAQLAACYGHLLRAFAGSPDTPLADMTLLDQNERHQMIVAWNQTARDFPFRDPALDIAARAEDRPERVALVWSDGQVSYGELETRVRALTGQLCGMGIGAEDLVGVMTRRSPALIVAILAVLRAGAAYVPLDPDFPEARLSFMLADAGAPLLILGEGLAQPAHGGRTLVLDREGYPQTEAAASPSPPTEPCPEQLAYTIYTSGSTGKPKGVQVSRGALANLLKAMRPITGLDADDRLLAVTTVSFDIFAVEIYLPLMLGARITLARREQAQDGQALAALLADHTVLQATPSTWRLLREADWQGGPVKALCGGEVLTTDLAAWLAPKVDLLLNLYGPTEATVYATGATVARAAGRVGGESIGRPIANTSVYILDERGKVAPRGAVGELVIGGHGLARGYRKQPALTAARFVPNPFAGPGDEGSRLYRTGDLARFRADGSLDFLGRFDHQVKIRGYRIELDEIRSALVAAPEVTDAVV